jgi:membrane protein
VYALQVLRALWQAQQRGEVVTVPQLHNTLHLRYERIEAILESMQQAAWVNRALPSGWVLHRNPSTISLADVYKRFVFDPQVPVPALEAQPELVSLVRDFGDRLGSGMEKSVADVFESAGTVGRQPVGQD